LIWSDEVYRIFGLAPQEFGSSYEAFLETIHPEDRAAVDAAYKESLREGKDSYDTEHRVIRKRSGEVRHVREKCIHDRDKNGEVIRSIGMVQDITEPKQADQALRASEEKYRALVENAHEVILVSQDGKIRFVNGRVFELFGYSPEQLVDKPFGW